MYELFKFSLCVALFIVAVNSIVEWIVYRKDRQYYKSIREGSIWADHRAHWQVVAKSRRGHAIAIQLVKSGDTDLKERGLVGGTIICGAEFLMDEYTQVSP